jgi:predicted RNA-binding Zn-ribbon protein involved in translation (DUF1610 family)
MKDKILSYLTARKVIKELETGCTLDGQGFPPGENFREVVKESKGGLLRLKVNGLSIHSGQRTIFSSNGIDKINCPKCGNNIIDSDWGAAVDESIKESDGNKIECPNCGETNIVVDYVFNPPWAFGEFGLTFRNWPPFEDQFIEQIEADIGKIVKVIHGKL